METPSLPYALRQAERDTIAEREALEAEEAEAAARERQRLEERKHVTRDLVAEQIAREDAAAEVLALSDPGTAFSKPLGAAAAGCSCCC